LQQELTTETQRTRRLHGEFKLGHYQTGILLTGPTGPIYYGTPLAGVGAWGAQLHRSSFHNSNQPFPLESSSHNSSLTQ